ncbi:MAG TPA: RNA polymerase sigma factor [Sphingobium sp.]|uniref:RNA polymerase sigma factor n=1 Tax=Sphingobium sp. TaxID=1912891 RepID=UPI002ED5F189
MPIGGLLQTFTEISPALQRFLVARGATPAEGEDILQDISLRISTETFGPISEPRAYLYKMASNHFQLLRRGDLRRTKREADWVDARSGEDPEVDQQASAEQSLIYREQLAILRAALDRLPERTRSIFTRFRIDGEPQKQIAADLGISVSAIEKHLTRAYEEIASARQILDEDRSLPRHLSQHKGQYER